MTQILDRLTLFNPWWRGEFEVNAKDRDIYKAIKKFLPEKQIIALVGLRRTGKTTLLYRIVEDSIKTGKNPRKILYFSFDDAFDLRLDEVIKEYERVMEVDINQDECLVLFDEIQKVKNWSEQLKIIYDSASIAKHRAKIVVSGSESLFIRRHARESLAGRIFEFKVEPLTFKEFVNFKGEEYHPIDLHREKLTRLFDEFVKTQGFPELVGKDDPLLISKYIQENVINKVIFNDIPILFRIADISLLYSLFKIISGEPGQIVDYIKLSKELQISRHTVSEYMMYLEESMLVKKLYNFSNNPHKSGRKLRKYYPLVIPPELTFSTDNSTKSKVFEWAVVEQLSAEYFWRDSYKNEVDAVLPQKIPVEIKYGKIETKGVEMFMSKFAAKSGIILSKEIEEELTTKYGKIRVIPAFEYFLSS